MSIFQAPPSRASRPVELAVPGSSTPRFREPRMPGCESVRSAPRRSGDGQAEATPSLTLKASRRTGPLCASAFLRPVRRRGHGVLTSPGLARFGLRVLLRICSGSGRFPLSERLQGCKLPGGQCGAVTPPLFPPSPPPSVSLRYTSAAAQRSASLCPLPIGRCMHC